MRRFHASLIAAGLAAMPASAAARPRKPLGLPEETAAPFGPRWFRALLHPSTPNASSLCS